MSDPTLGFSVDTSGLDKGNQALDQTLDKSKKVEDQANKTSDALGKMGAKSGDGLGKTAQSADQLAASLVKASGEAQKSINVSQALDTIVSKTGVSYTQANAAIRAAIDAHKAASQATTEHATSVGSLANAAGGAIPPITNLGQIASAASGGGLSGLGAAARSAGLDVAAMALGVTTAVVAITKAGDEVERSRSRFTAITGSVKEGSEALSLIKASANATGVEFGSLASAIELAAQGADKMNTGWPVIYVNNNQVAASIRGLVDMFGTLDKVMQVAGATAKEESQVQSLLAAGIQKTGGLTVDTFQQIRDVLPQVGRAIASAFGYRDIDEFQKQLAKTPIPLQQLEDQLSRIKPAVDAAFNPDAPKTFEQATREVSNAWEGLLETMAQIGAFDGVKSALTTIGAILRQDAKDALALAEAIKAVAQAASGVGGNVGQVLGGNGQGGSANAQYDPLGNVTSSAGGAAPDYSFSNSSFINDNVASGFGVGPDLSVGNPAGDTNFIGNFADGGSFVVPGTGGTDSFSASMNLTPGEIVDIHPPGSLTGIGDADASKKTLADMMPGGDRAGIAAANDVLAAHFAEDIKTQTAALSERINAASSSISTAVSSAAASISNSVKQGTTASSSIASTAAGYAMPASLATGSNGPTAAAGGSAGGGLDNEPANSWFSTRQKQRTDSQSNSPTSITLPSSLFGSSSVSRGTARSIGGPSAAEAADLRRQAQEDERYYQQQQEYLRKLDNAGLQLSRGQYGQITGVERKGGSFPVRGMPLDPTTGQSIASSNSAGSAAPAGKSSLAPQQQPDIIGKIPASDTPFGQPTPLSSSGTADQYLKQQTDTLKQAQDTGAKTIADHVKSDADQSRVIGDKTNTSLGDISKFSSDQLKSLDTVQQSTKDGTDATKADTDATKSGFDDTRSGLGDIQTAATQTNESVGQTTDAVSSGSSSIVDAVNSLGSSLSNAVGSAANSSANNASGTPVNSSSSGFASDVSSGSISSAASNSGFDFASAVADGILPAFASGGQFTVSGSGGTDTEHVQFMATPGEVVTVTPPGGKPPANPANGAGTGTKNGMRAFADGGQFTVGSQLGISGNPGATADLISAHFAATQKDQTVSLKDAIEELRLAVVNAIDTGSANITSAINELGGSIGSSSAIGTSSVGSATGATSQLSVGQAYAQAGGQNPAIAAIGNPAYYRAYPGANPAIAAQLSGFAEGGSFTVGGSGGTDTQVVKFKATPGEIVSITPPGKQSANDNGQIAPLIPLHNDNIPGSSFSPTLSMTPQTSSAVVGRVLQHGDPSAYPDQTARNVNIFVQAGLQADDFIRSRAEIKRAMG